MEVIEVKWEGPFKLNEISKFNSEIDYGVYQIYGTHNIFGSDTLLYIGKAVDNTFAVRSGEKDNWIKNEFHDIKFFLGRLGSSILITKEKWNQDIDLTERILIDHCQPPFNSQLDLLTDSISNNLLLLNFNMRFKLPYSMTTKWRDSSFIKKKWKPYSNKMY